MYIITPAFTTYLFISGLRGFSSHDKFYKQMMDIGRLTLYTASTALSLSAFNTMFGVEINEEFSRDVSDTIIIQIGSFFAMLSIYGCARYCAYVQNESDDDHPYPYAIVESDKMRLCWYDLGSPMRNFYEFSRGDMEPLDFRYHANTFLGSFKTRWAEYENDCVVFSYDGDFRKLFDEWREYSTRI